MLQQVVLALGGGAVDLQTHFPAQLQQRRAHRAAGSVHQYAVAGFEAAFAGKHLVGGGIRQHHADGCGRVEPFRAGDGPLF